MKISTKELDDTDKHIIERIRKGDSYKEVAVYVHKSVPVVKYRIQVMKKYYKCRSLIELVDKLP